MKPWYQYRCEEVDIGPAYLYLFFQTVKPISHRLKRFLLYKALSGDIHWEFSFGWSER